jgi:fructose-1-phosphate kinase PfkB-like protein
MIVTVTLNPAIDHTLVLPKFVAGDYSREVRALRPGRQRDQRLPRRP